MILYHGTNTQFDSIELKRCRPFKDFGKGFYLTDIEDQATKMAIKKTQIFSGIPTVLKFEFDETFLTNGLLNCLTFNKPNRDWAEFIYKNRSRNSQYTHDYDKLNNQYFFGTEKSLKYLKRL